MAFQQLTAKNPDSGKIRTKYFFFVLIADSPQFVIVRDPLRGQPKFMKLRAMIQCHEFEENDNKATILPIPSGIKS